MRMFNLKVKDYGKERECMGREYMKLFAVEHHCNEMVEGDVQMISSSGFTLDSYCDELEWKDMIVEDLAMVLDYLRTGNW